MPTDAMKYVLIVVILAKLSACEEYNQAEVENTYAPRWRLNDIKNHTWCPWKEVIDVDPTRVPKRIKMFKCLGDHKIWCRKYGVPDHTCCSGYNAAGNAVLGCHEMVEDVDVHYPAVGLTQSMMVYVGCYCTIEPTTKLMEAILV